MSRFFRHGDSSSEESSSDEEELYSEEEEEEEQDQPGFEQDHDENDSDSDSSVGNVTGAKRFLKDAPSSDSEDSDDEEKGQVKSAKDKRYGELGQTMKAIENGSKIGDWNTVANEFDKLNRQVAKIRDTGTTPKIYIEAIAELEAVVHEANEKQKVTPKKMNAQAARGFNAVKQRIKKNNKEYQDLIKSYREDKLSFMESSDEEEEAVPVKPRKLKFDDIQPTATADDDDEGFTTVDGKGKVVQFTPESIFKHLRTIMETRGKKNVDRVDQIKVMEKLLSVANTSYSRIKVLLTLISARFDLSTGPSSSMPLEHWKAAEKELGQLLTILDQDKQFIVIENAEEWEDDEKAPTLAPGEKYIKIPGSVVSYMERLDDELTRSLQQIDPHTSEYIERLQDEGLLYNVIFRCLLYYEALSKDNSIETPQDSINRNVMRRLEHIYFKPSQVVKILEDNCWKEVPDSIDSNITPRRNITEAGDLIRTLSNYLFASAEGIIKARAMLCQIYFMALHDDYYLARDMMLMSHLQEQIPQFDVATQILYNRTLVQVGLCAFRKGLVYDAQHTLQDICGSGRQKELLAQGVQIQKYSQVSPEQERLERQRQLPFHMHINLELLECVYLTCSMLLEIPLLAQTGSSPDVRKKVISKPYRRMLEYHERQIFTGPPENTRDHVMQASKALAAGEWKKAINFIHQIKIWDLMPQTDDIKTMLSKQIQEEGLRTYLFTYAPFYDSLSVTMLSSMFELEPRKVSAVVSKMISHEELAAALDQVTSTVVFRKGVELSRLQSLSLALADKASSLIETNERTLEQRTQGSSGGFDRQGGRGRGGGQRTGQRTGRGGARTGQRQAGGTMFTGGALGNAVRG